MGSRLVWNTSAPVAPSLRNCGPSLLSLIEESPDLRVAGLPKVQIPLTDCTERPRPDQADDTVGQWFELPARGLRSHRHGDDDSGRVAFAKSLDRGPHRRTRREAVVDQDHRATRGIGGRPAVTKQALAKQHRIFIPLRAHLGHRLPCTNSDVGVGGELARYPVARLWKYQRADFLKPDIGDESWTYGEHRTEGQMGSDHLSAFHRPCLSGRLVK